MNILIKQNISMKTEGDKEKQEDLKLDLSEESLKEVKVTETTPAALVPEYVASRLIVYVAREYKMTNVEAFAALAIICQKGGTAKGAQGSVYAIINGKKVELTGIRRIMRENGLNYTLRQWARTYASQIYKAARIYGIPGDLSKKIGRNNEISLEEAYWLSNFQMDNTDAPANVRYLLMEHYQALFGDK